MLLVMNLQLNSYIFALDLVQIFLRFRTLLLIRSKDISQLKKRTLYRNKRISTISCAQKTDIELYIISEMFSFKTLSYIFIKRDSTEETKD